MRNLTEFQYRCQCRRTLVGIKDLIETATCSRNHQRSLSASVGQERGFDNKRSCRSIILRGKYPHHRHILSQSSLKLPVDFTMPLFGRSEKKPEKKTRTQRAGTPDTPRQSAGETPESEERFGLFELWPNTPLGENPSKLPTVMDIVAVHGLGGHPYKTWTEGQSLWLRDFLPKVVPDARVFTFGYNSDIAFGGTYVLIQQPMKGLLPFLKSQHMAITQLLFPVGS